MSPAISLGRKTETQIRRIRQILTNPSVAGTDVSGDLWKVISDAFQVVVPSTKDFNLYTFSPDQEVCARVWPPQDSNLPTADVFGNREFKDELVESQGKDVFVHIFGGQGRRLMTGRFDASITQEERESLEWLSAEIGAALMERRHQRALAESEALRDQLQMVDDHDRPNVLLQFFFNLLLKGSSDGFNDCGGELRVVCESSEEMPERHLMRVAHTYGDPTEQPLRTSSATKLVEHVFKTKIPAVVVGRTEQYSDLEPHMVSCVKLPVTSWDGHILGMFCIHLNREYCFNLGMVHVAELLIERCAAFEVERTRHPDEMTRRAEKLRNKIPTPEYLNEQVRDKDWADARHFLYEDLSKRALAMTGAFRAAVALVGPDLTTGVGVGGTAGDWGPGFDGTIIEFGDEKSGVIEALKKGVPYLVEDVDRQGVRFMKIGNHSIGSTANIPISAGCNRLGVLDVEWVEKGGYDDLLVRYLTELCNVYGFILNSVGIERHFVELEDKLKVAERNHKKKLDYPGIMRLVAEMFGVREGAILIRDPDTGRFFFRANLLNEKLTRDRGAYYEPDEGLTGWIISNNKTERRLLKKADLRTGISTDSTAVEPRPWLNKYCDNLHNCQNTTSFLGAPISSGNEVFGVIRLNSEASIREFDSIDERNLTAVALRIAECLAQRVNSRRSRAKLMVAQNFLRNKRFDDIAKSIFRGLSQGVGCCRAHLRLLDRQRVTLGDPQELLVRSAVSDPAFIRPTLFHGKEGTAAGRVWETREPFDDPDVRNQGSPSHRLCTEEFCRKVGAVYVVPLKSASDEFVGTMHVYKKHRQAFNDAEKAFLREFSEIVAAGIIAVTDREKADVLHKVVTTQEDMLRRFMAGETFHFAQRHLLLDVMQELISEMSCIDGWLAVPADNGYELCDKLGLTIELRDPVEAELLTALSEGLFLGVGPDVAPKFIKQLPVSIDDETQFVLLPVRVQQRLLACFVLLHQSERLVRHESATAVLRLLDRLGEFLQLVEQVKDAQIGLPLMLLGTRASVLQHKSRKPFAMLKGLCERSLNEPNLPHDEREQIVSAVKRHVERLDEILEIMQDLVQMATADPQPVNILGAIAPTVEGLLLVEKISVKIQTNGHADKEFVVAAREGYLRTAFEFLLNNARDAIGKKEDGEILIELERDGDRIYMEIIDNGGGMGRETLLRAIEPGFTTKGGTGLGLPSAYSIIASHGGHLTLLSELGIGTTCRIILPTREVKAS